MSTAPAAVAASIAANAAASLNARLLLFCIVPPYANVFADDYYKCRVGISQFTGSAERLSKQRAIHLGNASFTGYCAASGRLFALLTLPSTARAFILHAEREQNASTSTVRLGPEGYVARAQHEMPAAATIEVRGPHHLSAQRPVFVTHVTQRVTHSRHTAFAHIPTRIGHNRQPRALHAHEFEGH
jgi:hypothetical protein